MWPRTVVVGVLRTWGGSWGDKMRSKKAISREVVALRGEKREEERLRSFCVFGLLNRDQNWALELLSDEAEFRWNKWKAVVQTFEQRVERDGSTDIERRFVRQIASMDSGACKRVFFNPANGLVICTLDTSPASAKATKLLHEMGSNRGGRMILGAKVPDILEHFVGLC